MPTATRNRPAHKTRRTTAVAAHRLRPGHRLTGWGTTEPVAVVAVTRTGQRTWRITVAHPCGTLEAADLTVGQKITREL